MSGVFFCNEMNFSNDERYFLYVTVIARLIPLMSTCQYCSYSAWQMEGGREPRVRLGSAMMTRLQFRGICSSWDY